MKYEILNILTKSGDKWSFKAQLIDGETIIPVSGQVENFKTDGMIKRAILEKMEEAELNYTSAEKTQATKALTGDIYFKAVLTEAAKL